MIITNLSGQSELLTDYKDMERVQRVNGEHSLSFFVVQTERNKHAFDLLQEESIVEYDEQEYRVKTLQEYTVSGNPVKRIERAQHVFFDNIDEHQYETLSGSINATRALNHIFDVTDWSWINHGAFDSVQFENFGNDNALSLFSTFLERYGAEFEITGPREVTLKNQIGELKEEQFRYQYNIKTLSRNVDTSNLSTYIKGYGKETTDEEGNVISVITTDYTSPNASLYGIRHASPETDKRFESEEALRGHLKKIIKDTPDISIEIEVVHLGMDVKKGDGLYLIYEPLNLDLIVRVMEYRDYPESFKSPVVTLSSIMQSATDRMVSIEQVKKNVKQLTDADGNLSLKLKRLYSDTNIFHDNTGSWYYSPEDANRFVHLGSGGLDIHRGLARIERDDGYPIIIGGKLNHALDIQGAVPTYKDSIISITDKWFETTSENTGNCQLYTYDHKARYLKVQVPTWVESGATCTLYVRDNTQELTILGLLTATNTDPTDPASTQANVITVDLGVPTGNRKSFLVQMKSSVNGKWVRCRVVRCWLEG